MRWIAVVLAVGCVPPATSGPEIAGPYGTYSPTFVQGRTEHTQTMVTEHAAGDLKVETDRFTRNRHVILTDMELGESRGAYLRLSMLSTVAKGATPVPVAERASLLSITAWSARESHTDCLHLDLLVDGAPFRPADQQPGVTRAPNVVGESVSILVTPGQLVQLTSAKSIEGRFCVTEFVLTPSQIGRILDFAREVAREE